MPIHSKNLQQQDLPLQGEHDPLGPVACIPESIHSQPTECLTSHHHVSTGIHSSRLTCGLQDYKNSHVPVSQKVMSCMQGSNDSLSPPLLDSVNLLPCEAKDEECLKVHETSDRSCTSFHIGDPIMQEHYGTFKTILPVGAIGSHQAEDLQVQNSIEDFVNPAEIQEDMETCNDSSINEIRAEPMDSDENGKEHTPKSCSGFQPPACSSSAFSLMMADSEHNPSTSGYSSEQPAKAKTQKELMNILKELRSYLPPEKQLMGKSSTMASLRYALHCMQQVKANEEYYQQLLLMNDEHPYGHDLSYYTVEEIANITSEFTKNNMDVFAAAVSLESGRILYISEQASAVLRSSADLFSQVRFVELLAPQDVSVFYSSTTPYQLPSWSMCNGSDSGHLDGLEEKSFYCRISCGQESRKELSYHPFRLTPYLIRVQTESAVEQLCCVLFAERVHSGYEAPRIPADKRIFTTTHTPNCLFQNVDERAVPLLGYLPQDLIGTPIILHLHPSDRPLMLAVHKKILQYGGQPFDFSPMRFCARNGEYVTIDTSWSSFINPWSRKVAFIIGRHKVRMGPGNEDVFTAPMCSVDRSLQPDIQDLTEQIHQLLMQPVHNSGSSGYGSLGSNGSHENPMSGASSSDSNGNLNEDIKEKHGTHQGHRSKDLNSSSQEMKGHQSSKGSPEPGTSHSGNGCSKDINSEGSGMAACPPQSEPLPAKQPPYSYQQINCLDSVIRYLESCSVLVSDKRELMSSGKTTSSASDDHIQMREELEDGQSHSEIPPILPGNTEKEPYKQLGLTKEVLVAHTQKEESNFLSGFMDVKKLSSFQTRCNTYMHEKPVALRSHAPQGADPAGRKSGKTRKSKVKRVRPESWDSSSSGVPQAPRCPLQGLNTTAWSQSDTSRASCPPLPYPVLPAYSLPVFPSPQIPVPNDNGIPMPNVTSSNMQPFPSPLLTPMVALMLPNYMYPPNLPPNVYPGAAPSHPFTIPSPFYTPQATFPSTPTFPVPQPVFTPAQHGFPVPQPSCVPQPVQSPCPMQPFSYQAPPNLQKMKAEISRSSTPRDPPSPPLFQSRCSSPLQLNLLQLEESQKADQSEGGAGIGGPVNCTFMPQPCEVPNLPISLAGYPNNDHTSDAVSTGSDLMDILLQEDACSGTCSGSSAVSESLTSGSNGNGTSVSQAGSSQTCHSSKYFASVDSSENNQKAKQSTSGRRESVMKYVLQDPMWLLMANADEKVMMTYQIPQREIDRVLKEDRNRLKSMQKLQPRFTEEQKRELGEIHPWIQRGGLPCAVELAGCIFCKDRSSDGEDCTDSLQDLELSRIMESCE